MHIQNEALKKTNRLEDASNKEISQIIISLKARYKLADLVSALPISMLVFQYWQKNFKAADPDEELKQRIKEIYKKNNGNYGVRRIAPEVRSLYQADRRKMLNHKKIQRLMHEMGLPCLKYNKRIKKYDYLKDPNEKRLRIVLTDTFKAIVNYKNWFALLQNYVLETVKKFI